MNFKLSLLSAAMLTLSLPTLAQDTDLSALQAEIEILKTTQSEQQSKIDSLSVSREYPVSSVKEEKYRVRTFMSVGLSQTGDAIYNAAGDESTYAHGQDSDLSILTNTWFGIQLNADIYDGGEFVVQMIAEGDQGADKDNLTPSIEWMYLKHDLGAGFNVQAGRIRFPVFAESEVYYIGNTYAWVRPPAEIYNTLPLTRLDGVSLNGSWSIGGDWVLDAKALLWANDEKFEFGVGENDIRGLHGLVLNFSNDIVAIRAATMFTKESYVSFNQDASMPADGPVFSFEDKRQYNTLAIKYDDGLVYTQIEGVAVSVDESFLPEDQRLFATLGLHFGNWLPYIGYGITQIGNEDELLEAHYDSIFSEVGGPFNPGAAAIAKAGSEGLESVLNREQKTLTAGFKWNFSTQASLKFQVQKAYDFGELSSGDTSIGNFSHGSNLNDVDDVLIYDLAIQAVF